jgi:hypothetical protein
MLKKLMLLTLVFAVVAFAAMGPVPVPEQYSASELCLPPSLDGRTDAEGVRPNGFFAFPAPGDEAGITHYDYQQNGAMGNRVMIGSDGYAHVCWMYSEGDHPTYTDRAVYYNAWNPTTEDFDFPGGQKASGGPRAGYTTMGLMNDGRAVVAFHHTPDANVSAVVVDVGAHLGTFSSPVAVDAVSQADNPIWPHIAVGDDIIHVIAHSHYDGGGTYPSNFFNLFYSRSTDEGANFSTWESLLPSASDGGIAVSADGSKVGIAGIVGVTATGYDHPTRMGNVYVVESTNSGESFASPVNITDGRYADEVEVNPDYAWFFANVSDLDCGYDNDGNLHVLFEEGWWNEREGDSPGGHGSSHYYAYWGRVMHWSSATDEVTRVSGPHGNIFFDDPTFDSLALWGYPGDANGGGCGAGNPQLTVWGDNLVATWGGQWDTLDLSAGYTVNGDIYAAISTDGGANWGPVADWWDTDEALDSVWGHVTNITNTHSPNASPGECEDESYHTVYPWTATDGVLHTTFIHDLFPASVVQPGGGDGVVTPNPVKYWGEYVLKVGERKSAVEETPTSNKVSVAVLGENLVANSVAFSVSAPGHASFKIYDAAGSLVQTLLDADLSGNRTLTWDTRNVASGVYFYSFVTPVRSANGRVVVVH